MSKTISAAANPALANNLIQKALTEEPTQKVPEVVLPSDTIVELPGGYLNAAGEVIKFAEVRELNGKDEEAISKTNNMAKALLIILQRGTVTVGDEEATDKMLDSLLVGDRDALLLGILKATFGPKATVSGWCNTCNEPKEIEVDLNTDISFKILTEPIDGRVFTVKGKKNEYTVQLPNGIVQKELVNHADKTSAELTTVVLENTVMKINNNPVFDKSQVQSLPVVDRRNIIEEMNLRAPGPQFDDVLVNCPNCESEVRVPINLGILFQF